MEPYSTETRVVCLIRIFCLFITGTVGNLLIIWTVARIKHLRTTLNMIVVCLAVFDLLICGYLLPFHMHVLISNQEPGKNTCRFQAVITNFLFSCSIMIILLIALSRYFKICHRQKYPTIFVKRNIIGSTVFLCFVAASFASPPLFSDDLWSFERPLHTCIFNRYGNLAFSIVLTFVILVLPVGVISCCYVQIFRYVRKARVQLKKLQNIAVAKQRLTKDERSAKIQFFVFITYMLLYFPSGIISMSGQGSLYPDVAHTVSIYLCYLNSCLNCILYGVFNKTIRRAYLDSMLCAKRKHLIHPSSVSRSIHLGNSSLRQQSLLTQT